MPATRIQRSATALDGWGHRVDATELSWTLRLVDAGFLGLILLLPFIWGGRQALGNFATVLLSGWTAFWWAMHQLRQDRPRWRFSGAEPLFLMAILLVVIQTTSLPEALKDSLSPQIDKVLTAWGDNPETSIGLGRWSYLSFAPWQSWSDLITLVSVMLVFFIAIQRLATARDVHRLIRFVAISGSVTALFGLTQYLLGNGKFFWFYEHPDTNPAESAKGAFTNANHFADFLAMSLPAQMWWFVTVNQSLTKLRNARNLSNPAPTGWRAFVQEWTPIFMIGLTSIAIVLSQSRGGLLITAIGFTITCVLFYRQGLMESRMVIGLLGIAVMSIIAMMVFGQRLDNKLSADIEAITAGNIDQVDKEHARQDIWLTDLEVVKDFPVVGTGLGTHQYVYHSYYRLPNDGAEYSHAENGYLQVAMETGITGLAITGLLIGLAGYWCIRGLLQPTAQEIKAPIVVAISILAINLTHSCTDFLWYVPGCMVIVVLAAASAYALYRLSFPPPPPVESLVSGWGRLGWGMMLVLVLAGLGWGLQVKWPEVAAEPHFHEYKRLVYSKRSEDGQEETRFEIAAIQRAAQANPRDPRHQMRSARAYLRTFLLQYGQDHDLPIEEVRQAALASNYPNQKALNAWLDVPDVMGENRRYLKRCQAANLRAMRLCPLEPRPYIDCARLAWLNLAPAEIEERLMKQALQVRPFEGQVLIEYAHALFNQGKVSESLPYYQRAFVQDVSCRLEIIADLAPHYPPEFFLNTFEVDRGTLARLRKAYAESSDTKGYQKILTALAQAELEASQNSSGETSALHLVAAHNCYAEMGDLDLATRTLVKAIKRHGNSYPIRLRLAKCLFDQGRYSEALPHLEWCLRRQPDEESVKRQMDVAMSRPDKPTQIAVEADDHAAIR